MALSYYDPTDHHPVPARPVYPTAEALRDARILRGICSDADCSWPIDGWCVGCRAKLCERHLHDHHNQHTREYLHAQTEAHPVTDWGDGASGETRQNVGAGCPDPFDDPDELAAHVRDDAGERPVTDWGDGASGETRQSVGAQCPDPDDDPGDLAAHLRDDAGATKVQRGDWVSMQSDPLGRMVGVVKRVAADGSWADVDWGRWTKRMQTAQLRMMVTLALRNGWTVTDMTRAAELEQEA